METVMEDQEDEFAGAEEVLDISQLCRACASPNEYLIPIFHGEGLQYDLKHKVSRLPLQIKETDKLPVQLCYQCASTLIAFSDLVEGCAEADAKLKSLLPEGSSDPTTSLDDQTGLQSDEKSLGLQSSAASSIVETSQKVSPELNAEGVAEQDVSSMDQEDIAIEPMQQRDLIYEETKDLDEVISFSEAEDTIAPSVEIYEAIETSVIVPDNILQGLGEGEYIGYLGDEYVESNIEVENVTMEDVELMYEKPYICGDCGKIFNNFNLYKSHIAAHQNKGHFCDICNTNYKRIDHLNKHIELMHPNSARPPREKKANPYAKTYLCNTCGRILKSAAAYENHTLKHKSDNPYECSQCSEAFPNRGARRRHEVKEHNLLVKENGNPDGYHVCEICGVEMFSDGAYYHHKDKHGEPFPCDHCGKVYSSRSLMQVHARRHTTERPFVCTLCNRNFKVKQELNAHMNIHKDLRPYACPHCPKTCRKSSDLVHHVRTHTGEKPYICDKCGRGFAQAGDMRKHRQLHFRASKLTSNLLAKIQ